MNYVLAVAAFFGATGVMLGAFAAHGLKQRLPEHLLSAFQTGVQYQLIHTLALLAIVLLYRQQSHALLPWAANVMMVGVLFFSGSLYLLATTGVKWFGPITPLGGLLLIIAWVLLLVAAVRGA